MLDLDANRPSVAARDASTVLLVRDRPNAQSECLEVFCVVRHAKSGFLGGAVVFPGGKVDETDRLASWGARATGARPFVSGEDPTGARAFAVAACREALEEAAILPAASQTLRHDEVIALRSLIADGKVTLEDALTTRGTVLDLSTLHPFARWVTPKAESRRFDTRFFLACAPAHQEGAHDAHETTATFWAPPREILRRFNAGEIQLAPPTHRCLELLTAVTSTAEAVALAARMSLEPICPMLVPVKGEGGADDTLALVLPGDPEHEHGSIIVPGRCRFVLREGRWLPEHPPA